MSVNYSKCIAIVGGGIVGVSTALALSKLGYKVEIFDKYKLLSQTSSKTSKLIHGGIRYLENFHFSLVSDGLKDREKWLEIYPDETHVKEFFIPVYKWSKRSKFKLFAGVKIYDLLSGKNSLGKSNWVNKENTILKNPKINTNNLLGSVSYFDVQMEDESISKLLIENLKENEVKINENTEVTNLDESGQLQTNNYSKKFDLIINSSGPWAHKLLLKSGINSDLELKSIRGSHLILNLEIENPIVMQNNEDNRIVFLLPLAKGSLLGTTEIEQNINDEIACSFEEKVYLINLANKYLAMKIDSKDIIHAYSGIRPIIFNKNVKNVSQLSREFLTFKNGKIFNIFGGKWTAALSISEKVAKFIQRELD